MNRLYFDYNATCPIRPEVVEAMTEAMAQPGNASSVHFYGRQAKKLIENARKSVAALTGAQASQVIFNSGATEGNNTVLKHYAEGDVWISAIEHSSVANTLPNAKRIPVTADGVVDLEALKEMLEAGPLPRLASVMYVNSETGAIQPIKEIAALVKSYGDIAVHSDAVQAAGRIDLDIKTLGIDYMCISGHKMGGPQGVGALVLGPCVPDAPKLIYGGTQETHRRAGTENVAGIVGLGKAASMAKDNIERYQSMATWRDRLEAGMKKVVPEMVVHAKDAPRVANVTNICWPGQQASMLLMNLDLEGVAGSTGSACSSGSMKPSQVLLNMGVAEDKAMGALRISMGWATTEDEIDQFLTIWQKIAARVKT